MFSPELSAATDVTEEYVASETQDLEALLVRAQEGDAAATEEFCSAIIPIVRGAARRYEPNPTAVEDLVQEGLIKVLRTVVRGGVGPENRYYQPGTNLRGLTYSIAIRTSLSSKQRERRTFALDDDELTKLPASDNTEYAVLHDPEMELDGIKDWLAEIPMHSGFRAAVYAKAQGLSDIEAANMLGIKLATYRTQLHRGLKAIRQAYKIPKEAPSYRNLFLDAS